MKKYLLFLLIVSALFVSSCEDEKNAHIQVWLTDDPGDYQQVNIDLQRVEINSTESENGWQSVNLSARIYNLLDLTNGKETLLGDLDLPAGRLAQIRLVLGENNTLKLNDEIYPLSTPSGQQSGLKLQMHQVLTEGITYKILLDFDAAKSVIQTGNEAYSLAPVIRVLTEAQNGAIKGKVEPVAGNVSISVMSGEETITTTFSDENGEFLVQNLEAGTYRLLFDAPGDGSLKEKTDVVVELGAVTDVGVISVAE
jgi:hypothetical protein